MRRSLQLVGFYLTLAVLGVLFLTPLGMVIRGGFIVDGRFTLAYLGGVFSNPIYAEGLRNSVLIAGGTTLLAALIAVPLAWLAHRFTFPGHGAVQGLLLVPMILPPFVGAIGFQQMFGVYGALNAWLGLGPVDWLGRGQYAGVVLLQALALYPVLYLNVAAALANIDPAMEEAAQNLGGGAWTRFRRIVFPLIRPGLFAGGTLVFIWSFTELGTPLMMNVTRCAPVQVYDALKEIGANPFPFALVFVMLSASVLLYAAGKLLWGRSAAALQQKTTAPAGRERCGGVRGLLLLLPFLLVIGAALLPHAGVALTSFAEPGAWYRSALPRAFTGQHYLAALGYDMTLRSIRNSLLYSGLAVAGALVLGGAVAFLVVRAPTRLRGVLDAVAMLPLAVPGLVMAFGYLALSSRLSHAAWAREQPWVQHLLDVQTNPTFFLVTAYAVRRLPYVVRSAVAGLQQVPAALEEAGRNLGASPVKVARRITLPLIAANLVAGGLLTFAFSMLEVSDSLILAQQARYYPITKTMYELLQLIGDGKYVACALGVWAMGFLAVMLCGARAILGRKLGALFRL